MGSMKSHFEQCKVTPDENLISILGKATSLPRQLILEALFIKEINPSLIIIIISCRASTPTRLRLPRCSLSNLRLYNVVLVGTQ